MRKIGGWAFLIGAVIAILTGFLAVPQAAIALFVLGLIVGFLNISVKNTEKYLVAAVTMIILGVASIEVLSILGVTISGILNAVLASFISFVGASALVVSVKAIIDASE